MNNDARSQEGPPPGWLVARRDGAVVVADRALCDILGVAAPESLLGRPWTSLVAPTDARRLVEVWDAQSAGVPWAGPLTLVTAIGDAQLDVELFPAGAAAGDLSVIRVAAPATPPPAGHASAVPVTDDAHVLLAATLAGEESADASSAARAVLQAVRDGLGFDWAVVLRFLDGTPPGAEVVATYPSGMAGMERGVHWSPLDDAERAVLESGEPALEGALGRRFHERSPLGRLPAFGMRSRLQIPVFAGARVRGCVSLYSTVDGAYTAADGVRLERLVRPLRAHLPPPRVPAPDRDRLGAAAPLPDGGSEPGRDRLSAAAPPPPGGPEPGRDRLGAGVRHDPPSSPPPPPPPAAPRPPAVPPVDEPVERARWEPGPRDRAELVARRLGALGEMVSGVAHELNNPLTAILGYAQILPTLDGADRDQALATIEQEALRASRIVRNLLAFARQHRTRTEPIDVEAVLRRVVDVRRRSLAEDRVAVETHFTGVPLVMGDEYQLEQVFLNLVNNAYQAMLPQGGVMTLTTEAAGESVRVVVSDTGPGVPEDVADRIFEPFFTTRDVGAGAGLGLAIVYGIVAEHGGHVWVERSRSGGAQFVVEVPRGGEPSREPGPGAAVPAPPAAAERSERAEHEQRAERAATAPRPDTGKQRRERILVVDDELPIRALTNEILGAAGYVIDTAASGEEALRQLEALDYDAVLADMRLPGLAGDALYRVVAGRWPRMRTRVLFITGDPEADREAERLDAQGARHLEKPFDTQTLLRAVRELLAAPVAP